MVFRLFGKILRPFDYAYCDNNASTLKPVDHNPYNQ